MLKPKKRLSGGMGLSADGVDPLFEFDVPRIFTDLTRAPRLSKDAPHDPWFDLVHEHHSRPTDEFLAEQQQQREHHARSDSTPMPRTLHQYHHPHADADGEKENAGGASGGATRLKRRNVAYTKPDATPVSTLKATMRTVSASAKVSSGAAAVKKPTKLPFGNSTGSSSSTVTPASKQPAANTLKGAHTVPQKRSVADRSTEASKARVRALPGSHRKNASSGAAAPDKDLQDLQALLAKHNKKFKTNHTYEPRQHSVRDVRLWEKRTQKSYYKLTLEDRFQANTEIAQLVREREEAAVP